MVGDDQLIKKTTGSGLTSGSSSSGPSKIISRWGELENSRSVAPRGVGFTTNPGRPVAVKTFTNGSSRHSGSLSYPRQPNIAGYSNPRQQEQQLKASKQSGPLQPTSKKVKLQNLSKNRVSPKSLNQRKTQGVKKSQAQSKFGLPKKVLAPKQKITRLTASDKKQSAKDKTTLKKTKKEDHVLIAIWGLIGAVVLVVLLLVFCVFLPKIQKEGRENARVQDMVKTSNAVVRYQRDHSGNRMNLPAAGSWVGTAEFPTNCAENSACNFVREYLNSSDDVGIDSNGYVEDYKNHFKDPDGAYYNLVITENLATTKNISKSFGLALNLSTDESESQQDSVVEETIEGGSTETATNLTGASEENSDNSEPTVLGDQTVTDNVATETGDTTTGGVYARPESLNYNGEGYEFVPARDMAGKTTGLSHTIYIVPGAKCRGELIVKATRNSFAVVYNFEDGARCLSNN